MKSLLSKIYSVYVRKKFSNQQNDRDKSGRRIEIYIYREKDREERERDRDKEKGGRLVGGEEAKIESRKRMSSEKKK